MHSILQRSIPALVAVLLLGACGTGADRTPVVSGDSTTSTTEVDLDQFVALGEAIADYHAEVQFLRAVEYATAVEEARIAAEAEAERRRVAEEAERQRRAAAAVQAAPAAPSGSVWYRLAECESHGEWDYNPATATWGSRIFEGGLQFHPDTWDGYRPAGYPDAAYLATPAQQIAVAERVLAEQGWRAWPRCSRKLGLR